MDSRVCRRGFVQLSGATALTLLSANAGFAQSVAPEQGKLRVNLSGRQRMLSQRMAKATVFLRAGVSQEMMLKQLAGAEGLFEATIDGFMTGGGDTGLTRERSVTVQLLIRDVMKIWAEMKPAVDQVLAAGSVGDSEFATIVELNLPLLKMSNEVVKALDEVYGAKDVDATVSKALDYSGRQRMLTQKMSKELGLVQIGHESEKNLKALDGTASLFNDSLLALKDRAADFQIAVADSQTAAKLAEISEIWQPQKELVDIVLAGNALSDAQLEDFVARTEVLLVESNKAVTLYQNADEQA